MNDPPNDPAPMQSDTKVSPTSYPVDVSSRTKGIADVIMHTDLKAHDRSLRNKVNKRRDSSSSDSTLVNIPTTQMNTREYVDTRLPGPSYEWPDMRTAGKPLLISSTVTIPTPPKSPSPEMTMPCASQRDGRKCSNSSNNPFDGLMEADLQRCAQDSLLETKNENTQLGNAVDHTIAPLNDTFAIWRLGTTIPAEHSQPARVQRSVKDSVVHVHIPAAQTKAIHRSIVSFVNPPSKPFVGHQQEQPSNNQMATVQEAYWCEHTARAGSGPPHRLPVEAKTVTITTMAQFKVLRTTVLSSNVVGISVKEDGMTTAKMIRPQPQFHFCVLQIVCSSDPHTVFKLEMHRLEHDACSRKDIFTGYDAAMTKTIIPGSSTARLLSAHLVVLLEELLKNPSIVKVGKFSGV